MQRNIPKLEEYASNIKTIFPENHSTFVYKVQSNLDLATLAVIRKYVAKSGMLLFWRFFISKKLVIRDFFVGKSRFVAILTVAKSGFDCIWFWVLTPSVEKTERQITIFCDMDYTLYYEQMFLEFFAISRIMGPLSTQKW